MIRTREHQRADSWEVTEPDATVDGKQEAPRSLNGNGGLNAGQGQLADRTLRSYPVDGRERPRLYGEPGSARVAQEFDAATAEVRAAIIQVRTRLLEAVQRELQRVAQDVFESPVTTKDDGLDGIPSVMSVAPPWQPVETGHERETGQPIPQGKSCEPEDGFMATGQAGLLEQVAGLSSGSCQGTELSSQLLDGELYEGTVRLSVNVNGCLRELVRFVDEVCQKPQCRLLRLVGNHREGLELWVGLREPLYLKGVLQHMKGVSRVFDISKNGSKSTESRLEVWLTDATSHEQA